MNSGWLGRSGGRCGCRGRWRVGGGRLRCWGSLLRRAETCAERQCAERTGKQQDKMREPCHWGTVIESTVAERDLTLRTIMPSSIVNDR